MVIFINTFYTRIWKICFKRRSGRTIIKTSGLPKLLCWSHALRSDQYSTCLIISNFWRESQGPRNENNLLNISLQWSSLPHSSAHLCVNCQAQSQLQVKLSLKTELALFSFNPAPTPTHHISSFANHISSFAKPGKVYFPTISQ